MAYTSLSDLRKAKGNFDKLMKEVDKIANPESTSKGGKDERFWQPEVDKAGNGYAVIRFLPAPKGEELPWVRIWNHGFQGPTGKWYIENSLTTLGQQDPVSELNNELWNSGSEANKDVARKQKRKLTYYTNILIVSDPKHPENEGKVFLFKFGKKIFDKIKDIMNPQFEDEAPINPFDFWEGANFKLKIRNVEGYRNYDKSEFEGVSALGEDDEIEKVWGMEHSLQDFLDPKNFKSYDELKKKLDMVLATGTAAAARSAAAATLSEDEADDQAFVRKVTSAPAARKAEPVDTDDDSLSYFAQLAEDD